MSGVLNLVSVGPGFADMIVPRACAALEASDVIVGYELYMRWIEPLIAGKEIHTPPLTQERERALLAIEKARGGATVALISSGDIGVYAMAALAFEEIRADDTFQVNVVPGITSANACASLLGSPLSHDFATLSLSDLLCPWDWIEHRARHIAQADLACVFYNVQSAARQQGVYRILAIMLESKAPGTLCGVVRNAYRPDQEVNIHRLDELPGLTFDMLTTVVIGNRFTERKGKHIFTPRGYNNWAAEPVAAAMMPQQALWVFSGTSDGNALAGQLAQHGYPVVVSAATSYGADVAAMATLDCPGVTIWSGPSGVEARKQALILSKARVLLDATHPYASLMSQQLIDLSRSLGIAYIRYERPSAVDPAVLPAINSAADSDATSPVLCDSIEHAAQQAIASGKRIFLSTGSKDVARFLQAPGAGACEWFVRVTPEPEMIQRALDAGLPRSHICAMQGPFSQAFNTALWQDWNIDCIVSKDSGAAGGYQAKRAAAQALAIPFLVIQRPALDYPLLTSSFDAVLQQVQAWDSPKS